MNIFILLIVIGGFISYSNCDESLCFEQLSECEKFSSRINRIENPGIKAMCQRFK
tara:strand:+ start:1945 stop:2109 length:165 start_codon:yes stop_codon:yes gene_type:complete